MPDNGGSGVEFLCRQCAGRRGLSHTLSATATKRKTPINRRWAACAADVEVEDPGPGFVGVQRRAIQEQDSTQAFLVEGGDIPEVDQLPFATVSTATQGALDVLELSVVRREGINAVGSATMPEFMGIQSTNDHRDNNNG